MKKTKLTRTLMAACSVVALSAMVYGCSSGPSQSELDAVQAEADANAADAAAAAAAAAAAEAAAAAAVEAQEKAEAARMAAEEAQAAAEAKAAADVAAAEARAAADVAAAEEKAAEAAAQAAEDAAARDAAVAAAAAAAEQAATAAAEAAEAKAAAEQAADDLAAAEKARMEAEDAAAAAKEAQEEAEKKLAEAEGERDDAQDALDDRDDDDAQAAARALKAALGTTPLRNLTPLTTSQPSGTNVAVPSLGPAGLMLGISARTATGGYHGTATGDGGTGGTAASRTPLMAPADSAGMLGDWAGTDYSNTHPVTGVSHSARAYRNRGDGVMLPFAVGASFGANEGEFDAAYTRATRTLDLGEDLVASIVIAADGFPAAGTINYTTSDSVVQSVVLSGTYQGAPGDFYCAGNACAATVTATGAITLASQSGAGGWQFVHDEGAMITSPDANYLYFGWWINNDGTGAPVEASAFTGVTGTVNAPATAPNALSGSATYAGHAAGKFAVDNPIGDDEGGHFTADAELTAVFGPAGAGVGLSGMLDNFMVNDEEPEQPWSVTLMRTLWGDGDDWTTVMPGDRTQTPVADPDASTPNINEALVGTIWSIDGNPAAASGSWSAQMYDETVDAAADGSAVPTSVTGTFQSHFGDIMTMVGAFGAERTTE